MIHHSQPEVFLVPADSPEYVDAIADQHGIGTSVVDTTQQGFPGLHSVALVYKAGLGVLMYLAPVADDELVA